MCLGAAELIGIIPLTIKSWIVGSVTENIVENWVHATVKYEHTADGIKDFVEI